MKLDHVIIAVSDLERAIEDFRALGFNVVRGGQHSKSTSHNALIVFADGAYFELIAWPRPDPAHRWYNVLREHGEGLMDFALIPDDVPRAIEAARARGLALNGPVDGGRFRPDGVELKWRTGRQTTFDLPFLCGDVTPREGRVPGGDARTHPNGATGIARVSVAVADRDATLARYRALLGEAAIVASRVRVAGTEIEIVETKRARGEGPCAVAIRTAAPKKGKLDASLTHGAALELVA